jgi:hypothetical protein
MAAPGVHPSWSEVEPRPMPRVMDWPNLGHKAPHVLMCPVCGHHVTVFVDTFAGDQRYVEDCPLCCRSIELRVHVSEYRVESVEADRPY